MTHRYKEDRSMKKNHLRLVKHMATNIVLLLAAMVVLLIAAAGYAVDAVYQRLYRLLRLPALETKLDALTARILQSVVGSKEV